MPPDRVLFLSDGIADAGELEVSPGAALVELGPGPPGAVGGLPRLLASGDPLHVQGHPLAASARRRRLDGRVLLPGLVNAHCHLDLTHIGPRPYDPATGFAGWAEMIRSARRSDGAGIEDSVRVGIGLSLAGGVVAVGDIAGAMRLEAVNSLRASGLLGVSFLEFFGLGHAQQAVGDRMQAMIEGCGPQRGPGAALIGLQPHSPYSVGLELYDRAIAAAKQLGLQLATHLAENRAERRLIESGEGPLRDMLERFGAWDTLAAADVGHGRTPIGHLAGVLRQAPFLAAHVNDCSDADLRILKESATSVAYCPRASAYFGNDREFGPHRYRDMLEAGITVALGTDSIVNLPATEASRLSTLDEMRFLWKRDRTPAHTLLAMATINGARALGLDESLFRLGDAGDGRLIAGLIAVDVDGSVHGQSVRERALEGSPGGGVELLVGPGASA